MLHKYFAYIDEAGFWRGQKLVSLGAVNSLRRTMAQNQHFASLQTYTEKGEVIFSPLYADLDGKAEAAQEDARYLVHLLSVMCGIIPHIYFSGNKGFHLVIPYQVKHPQCHLISRYFFEYLAKGVETLDKSVYRGQALLRLPNSPASKPGFFKVQLTRHELMTLGIPEILELAKAPRLGKIDECDISKVNDEFLSVLADAERNLPPERAIKPQYSGTFGEEITFCIQRMFEEPCPEGERNRTAQLLSRFLRKVGMPFDEALRYLLSFPHWRDFEDKERGVSPVLGSIYRSRREPIIGCRTGSDKELMRARCHTLCWWNEKRMDIRFGRPA